MYILLLLHSFFHIVSCLKVPVLIKFICYDAGIRYSATWCKICCVPRKTKEILFQKSWLLWTFYCSSLFPIGLGWKMLPLYQVCFFVRLWNLDDAFAQSWKKFQKFKNIRLGGLVFANLVSFPQAVKRQSKEQRTIKNESKRKAKDETKSWKTVFLYIPATSYHSSLERNTLIN